MISDNWIFNSHPPHPIIPMISNYWIFNSNLPNPIIPTNKYSILVQSMNVQLVICLCMHQMNIWSVICQIPAHTNWIFSWQSAWPIHTLNEYSVGQSAGPLHTPTEYLVGNPPDPCIHWMNIQLGIRRIPAYTKWIFGQQSAGSLHTPNEY